MNRRTRQRSGWVPDPIGALGSFIAEALAVGGLLLVTAIVAALALWVF